MNKGDVVLVHLPRPQGRAGREQYGTRPAVVFQDCSVKANLSTVVIVPLTSNRAAMRFLGAIEIRKSATNGLTADSIALTHQIRALDKGRVAHTLGYLEAEDLASLEDAVKALLDL